MKYRKTPSKKKVLDIISLALVAVIIILTILLGVFLIEKIKKNKNSENGVSIEKTIEYDGETYRQRDDVETYLIMGVDGFENPDSEGNVNNTCADFLMLLVFDKTNLSYTALEINRDTMTEVNKLGIAGDTIKTYIKQIALAHGYGDGKALSCRNTLDSASSLLLGTDIDHYISFTMDAVTVVNDTVGGVTLEVLTDIDEEGWTYEKGETVTLKGEKALTYVRARLTSEEGTNTARMERQRQYLEALRLKLVESAKDDSFIESLGTKISKYIVSDCSSERLQTVLENFTEYEYKGIKTIDGNSVKGTEYMEFYADTESLKKNLIELIYKNN